MPNPHIIVGGINRFDPPINHPLAEVLDKSIGVVRIHFNDDQVAKLAANEPEFEFRKEVLTDFHRVTLPVYVEVDPESRVIGRLLIPLSGKVRGVFRKASGIIFSLDECAKLFNLNVTHLKYRKLVNVLRKAQIDGAEVLLTESEDGSEIVDIRRDNTGRLQAIEEIVATTSALSPAEMPPVTAAEAERMFDIVTSHKCDPSAPRPGCIPFMFPDFGCEVRAHEMSRLIISAGVKPSKVWNFSRTPRDPLVVKTPNAPNCRVEWSFHVAVALEVQAANRRGTHTIVIDPSLFLQDGPVPVAKWQGVQGDPNSSLAYTSPVPYLPPTPENVQTDNANYDRTKRGLMRLEKLLKARARQIPFNCDGRMRGLAESAASS